MFCHLLCDDGSIYWALAKVKVLIPHVDFDSWSRIFVKGVLGGLMFLCGAAVETSRRGTPCSNVAAI